VIFNSNLIQKIDKGERLASIEELRVCHKESKKKEKPKASYGKKSYTAKN
jgi:hypothetical protein